MTDPPLTYGSRELVQKGELDRLRAEVQRASESCGFCGAHMSEEHDRGCRLHRELERLRARVAELERLTVHLLNFADGNLPATDWPDGLYDAAHQIREAVSKR